MASCDFFDVSVRTNSGNIQPNFEVREIVMCRNDRLGMSNNGSSAAGNYK